MTPVDTILQVNFQEIQSQIAHGQNQDAVALVQNLFSTLQTEEEAARCYQLLFELLPTLPSLGQLENNLSELLSPFPLLVKEQKELAKQIGVWFKKHKNYVDAMHAFAKALQIEKAHRMSSAEMHREASEILVLLLEERLSSFLSNSYPSVQTVSNALEELKKFSSLCFAKQDLLPFYTKVSDRLNNVPLEEKEKYKRCKEDFLSLRLEAFTPSFPTQKYWEAFDFYRKQFSEPIQEIRLFQKSRTEAFAKFFQLLMEDIFLLIGPPPCGYDIRAMGSLGRGEGCPYSDIEFMILIQKQTEQPYFLKLVEILEIQVASLGETERFPFVFTSIAPKNPSGLHIDYSPKQDLLLIQTPEEMAKLQIKPSHHPQDISHTVLRTVSLSQNDATLFPEYQKWLKNTPFTEKRTLAFLKLRKEDFARRWKRRFNPEVDILHIKEQYVELLGHLLSDLALYFGIAETNTLDIIDALTPRVFTEESGKLLKESVLNVYAIRIRLHLGYKGQKEEASCSPSPHFIQLYPNEILSLERIYWLALRPLYSSVQKILEGEDCVTTLKAFFTKEEKLYGDFLSITDPSKLDPDQIPLRTSLSKIPRYLKPTIANQIMEEGNISSMYPDSAHRVSRLQYKEVDLHIKQKPCHPLMEYAIYSLGVRMGADLTPPTILARIDLPHTSYPILISQTIPGVPLQENQPLDLKQWTWMLLLAILTRPGDGRLSNYTMQGQKIYSVDNDISFVEPVVSTWIGRTIQFCSAAFCLKPLETPLHSEALQEFLSLDAEALFDGWIEDLIKKEKEYMDLFSEQERKKLYEEDPKNAFTPTILFRQGALATLNLQFWRLQTLMQKKPNLTAGDLLQAIVSVDEQAIGPYIHKAYKKALGVPFTKRVGEAISRKGPSLTSAQYHQACLGKIPTLEEIEQAKLYSPQKAREEFFFTLLQRCSAHAGVRKNKEESCIEANFEQLEQRRQPLVLKALASEAETLRPKKVVLQHAITLDTSLLSSFLHPDLLWLDLRYSTAIDDEAPSLIQKKCPKLETLFLSGTNLTSFQGGLFFRKLEFPKLKVLHLDRCPHLQTIQIEAYQLSTFTAKHNPKLEILEVKSFLFTVDCKGSPKVQVNHLPVECIRTLKGHTNAVTALVLLADGTLASGSYDKTIKLWDPLSGALKQTLTGHANSVQTLVQLADGTLASGSSDYTIKLWDPLPGVLKQTLTGHTSFVVALVQLADGTLASGSWDNTIKLWDPLPGVLKQTLTGHTSFVVALVQLADGTLASGSRDNTIKLWDSLSGVLKQTLVGHTGLVMALVRLADGTLASGSDDKTIKLWDPLSGALKQTLTGHTHSVMALVQLADGTLASGSRDDTIKLWDPLSGVLKQTLTGHTGSVRALVRLADGTLASGSFDGTIKLWR